MKILYLHGYKGTPNLDRITYLEDMGFEVIAPQIDYDNEPDVLVDWLKEDYDAVIGNSLGGYLGFHLSEYKSIPAILINPPMYMELMIKINQPQDIPKPGLVRKKHIILGSDDDVVNPHKVLEWLFDNKPTVDLHVIDGMGHKYTQEQFIDSVKCIIAGWLV